MIMNAFTSKSFTPWARSARAYRDVRGRSRANVPGHRRLALEPLEDRSLLTAFFVNTIADDPAATAADTDGYVSLREAVQAANTNAVYGDAVAGEGGGAVDSITFDPTLTGQTIVLGGLDLTVSDDLSLTGPGAADLAISGNHASGVFWIDAGVAVEISGIAITGGSADDGGAIYNQGTLTVAHCALMHNTALTDGGAIENLGTLSVSDSVFSNNSASYGGAITNWSLLVAAPSLTIINSMFDGNSAQSQGGALWNDGILHIEEGTFSGNSSEGTGGAIKNDGSGKLTIAASSFSGNISEGWGGAIDSFGGFGTTTGSLDIAGTSFTDNSGSSGGAIWNWLPANISDSTFVGNAVRNWGGAIAHGRETMVVRRCTFANNDGGSFSGAIDNTSWGFGATLKLYDSTLAANSARREGGAVENLFGTLEIVNSTISGNSTNGDGGGVWNLGTMTVTNSTITGNRADADGDGVGSGGGIFDDGSSSLPLFNNTLVAGNLLGPEGADRPDDTVGVLDPLSSHNLIGDAATSGGLVHGVNGNIVGNAGAGTIDITTVLDPNLADNGGPTLTHALVRGGPAVNAGDNSLAVDAEGYALAYDQRGEGFAHIVAGTVDMGAFEVQPQAVEIDIKPGDGLSSVHLASNGVIAVAILTTDDFDAAFVDASTVVFAEAFAVHSVMEDVDDDGDLDMVLHFQVQDTNLAEIYAQMLAEDPDSTRQQFAVSLIGETMDGESFEGTDALDVFFSGKALRDLLEELALVGIL